MKRLLTAAVIAVGLALGIGVADARMHSTVEILDSQTGHYVFYPESGGVRNAWALDPTDYPCEELYWGEPELPPMVTTSWDGQTGTCEPAN